MLPPMRWVGGLVAAIVIGCQGETVQSAPPPDADNNTDVATDGAVTDTSAPADTSAAPDTATTDSTVSGDCGAHRGTKMVKVHDKFCIDAHEVTNGEWKEFAADAERAKFAPAHCSWNTTQPATNPDPGTDGYPRTKVNHCDAQTYCAWAGKRLCGKIGAGALFLSEFTDASKSQWHYACTNGGPRKYPYGDTYDAAKCATGSFTPVQPGTFTSCHGVGAPYDAVLDLSGNVDEWEDSCAITPPIATTLCRGRGGGTGDHSEATCDRTAQSEAQSRFDGLGFRCCKDL